MSNRPKHKKQKKFTLATRAVRVPRRFSKKKQAERPKTSTRFAFQPTGLIIPVDFELNIEEGLDPLSEEAVNRIQDEAGVIIEEAGRDIVGTARDLVPVRTGELQDSIRYESQGPEGLWIIAATPYAAYVEYGTDRMNPEPYLEPAIEQHQPMLQDALDEMILQVVADDADNWQDDPELELELETEAWSE